jgi:nucleotide-binding universal stress UspA family protein
MTTVPLTQGQNSQAALHLGTSPIHFKEILVATDFSEQATQSVRIAARLAKQMRGRLHVLHVVSPITYAAGTGNLMPALQEIDLRSAESRLSRYTGRIPEVRTLRHEEIVLCDSVGDAIPAVIESKEIDLLVMGSHGRNGLGKVALGSRAEAAIRHTHRPVLVIGPACANHAGPWKSIVLATNLTAGSLRAAQYATSIAESSGAALTLLHVLPGHSGENGVFREEEKNSAIEQLVLLAPNTVEARMRSCFEVAFGQPAEQILQIADRRKANLIIMGVREHGVMADHAPWATLSEVIRHAPCPVLAVRPHLA